MKKILFEIPVIEYYDPEQTTFKGIVFLVHGHHGNKELRGLESIPLGFMERGYFVVSVDAYKHGERIEVPYTLPDSGIDTTLAMPEVIYHTIQDIIYLFENHYQKIADKMIVLGTSMGGHVAFQMPKYYANTFMILPMIGSPDFQNHYFVTKKDILKDKIDLCKDEVNALRIDDLKPYLKTKIGIFNGIDDFIVEIRFVEPFVNKLKTLKHPNLYFESFPVGHVVNYEMVQSMFRFFDEVAK